MRRRIPSQIEAKKRESNKWEALVDNGREPTSISVLDWVKEAEKLGIGEILLTSVDKEGTQSGFDLDLIENVEDAEKYSKKNGNKLAFITQTLSLIHI